MKQLAQRICFVLLSIFLLLIILEGVARIFKPVPHSIDYFGSFRLVKNLDLVYEFIPGAKVDGSIINPQGFKDTPFIQSKGKDVIRIAMLGDSITQGIQVPLGKTFSDFLEISLNEESAQKGDKSQYEVMNFGVCGYNLAAEIELLKTKVVLYSPDIVIFNYYYNDSDPIPGYHMFIIDKNSQLSQKDRLQIIKKYYHSNNPVDRFIKKNFLNHSRLYFFIFDNLGKAQRNIFNPAAFFNKNYGDKMAPDEINMMHGFLKDIEVLSRGHGFKVLFCIHGFLVSDEHPNNTLFVKLLQEKGLLYFNMIKYYKEKLGVSGSNAMIGFDHCHPNAFGHAIIADAMLFELKKDHFIN